MKACVAYGGGASFGAIFADWLARRRLLDEIGVSTPALYATGPALLVEEYIPYLLTDRLAHAQGVAEGR